MVFITDNRAIVRRIQFYLYEIAQSNEGFPIVYPDGIYGKETKEAVKAFQLRKGFKNTGEVDYATWVALVKDAKESKANRTIAPFPSAPKEAFPLRIGSRGHAVVLLRSAINELSAFYVRLQRQSPTSVYQYSTASAVRNLQKIYGLPETGEVNISLWNRIFADLAAKHGQAE